MKSTLGNQEILLLKFLSARQESLTVREITEEFGAANGLARTTILTMLERLRKKEFVTRAEINGVNHYRSTTSKSELLQEIIGSFVEKTLEGSLSPFMTYLTQKAELSDTELAEFKQLIENLEKNRTPK